MVYAMQYYGILRGLRKATKDYSQTSHVPAATGTGKFPNTSRALQQWWGKVGVSGRRDGSCLERERRPKNRSKIFTETEILRRMKVARIKILRRRGRNRKKLKENKISGGGERSKEKKSRQRWEGGKME
jgi:hypothetical protein